MFLCKSVILALAMFHIAAKKSMRVVTMATIVNTYESLCACVRVFFKTRLDAKLLTTGPKLATQGVYTHWVIYFSLVV